MPFLFVSYLALASLMPELPGAEVYWAGCEAQKRGDYASASRRFAEVATDSPLSAYARVREAVCRARAEGTPESLRALQSLVLGMPGGPAKRMGQVECAALLAAKNNVRDAVTLYAEALPFGYPTSWGRSLTRTAAEVYIKVPEYAERGYPLLVEAMRVAPLRRDKAAIAKILAGSPDIAHRLESIEVLLDAGEYRDAQLFLLPLLAVFSPTSDEERDRVAYLRGRNLLVGGNPDEGRAELESLRQRSPDSEWARKGFASLVRFFLQRQPADEGKTLLKELVRRYPDTVETGDVLLTYAERLSQGDDVGAAIALYLELAEKCPSHARAANALLLAADLQRERADRTHAIKTYLRLVEKYPRDVLVPEAAFRAGVLAEAQGRHQEAAKAFRKAADGPIGNFYVHRSLGRLAKMGKEHPQMGESIAVGLKTSSWLREKKPAQDERGSLAHELPPVLCFLGYHGLEEAEWEAVSLIDAERASGDVAAVLQVIAEAGLAASAASIARDLKLGETDDGPTPVRLRIDYPRAYFPLVERAAQETGLDPYLLLGLGRQESLFQARVVSSAGATGVLQLMPATAEWLARVESAITSDEAKNLDVPMNSLRLGAHYLMRMLERYDGNLIFAAAAYNAGPGNVNKWRNARPNVDMDTFIDTIPFRETRGFVRKVLGNYAACLSLYTD